MKVAILGPGDYSIISKYSKLNEKDIKEHIENFGKFLAENDFEIIIAVDRGIPYEVAKVYKKHNGKKVYGVNPESHEKYDKQEVIKPFLDVRKINCTFQDADSCEQLSDFSEHPKNKCLSQTTPFKVW